MAYYQQVRPAFIGGGGDETEYFSHSYLWSSKDKLGQGATGQVFAGYHKVKRECVCYLLLFDF